MCVYPYDKEITKAIKALAQRLTPVELTYRLKQVYQDLRSDCEVLGLLL